MMASVFTKIIDRKIPGKSSLGSSGNIKVPGMINLFGKQLHTFRVMLFLLGMVVGVGVDLFIKAQIEEYWVRVWSPDLVFQENEALVTFTNDPEQTRLVVKETTVIENFWSLVYVRNYNVGFSILSFVDHFLSPESQLIFFKMLQLMGLLFVGGYFFFYGLQYPLPFFLILTGGAGNVIDRWYRGYVVDYMKWYIQDSPIRILDPWPIFNLADSMITVGIFSLLIRIFFLTKSTEASHSPPSNQNNNPT